tara:strand:+ start:107 stop:229 length:123 start_codon:yes stop_codon:yes gene_type:complete
MKQELLDFLEWTMENVTDVTELIDEHEDVVNRYLDHKENE